MKIKFYVLISFLLPVLFGLGCSNTLMPYHKDYSNRMIQVVLYVPDLPLGEYSLPLIQSALYGDDIKKALDAYVPSAKNAIVGVFEAKHIETSKIKVIVDKKFATSTIPQSSATENDLKTNPSLIRYGFSKISGNPENIFEFRIIRWYECKSGMSVGLGADCDIAIYDTTNNIKVYEGTVTAFHSYPGLFSSWTDCDDPKVLDDTFKNVISDAIDLGIKELK